MAQSTQESQPNNAPPPAVPNFREDERIRARYDSMLQRRIKTHFVDHEGSIRRNASTKRDELRDELRDASEEWEDRKQKADVARDAYRKAYPHHVKKIHLNEPSVIENLKSRGAASKLYQAAKEAWQAAENAASNIRRLEHNENQLEIELEKALERAPAVSKDVTESEEWLAEIHAEEEMAAVKAKVDEILAEREHLPPTARSRQGADGRAPPARVRRRRHQTRLAAARRDHLLPHRPLRARDLLHRSRSAQSTLRATIHRRLEALADGVPATSCATARSSTSAGTFAITRGYR